jgi:hypothetical protein
LCFFSLAKKNNQVDGIEENQVVDNDRIRKHVRDRIENDPHIFPNGLDGSNTGRPM